MGRESRTGVMDVPVWEYDLCTASRLRRGRKGSMLYVAGGYIMSSVYIVLFLISVLTGQLQSGQTECQKCKMFGRIKLRGR